MKDFIQILEVIILSILLVVVLYLAHAFVTYEAARANNVINAVGPIIKLDIGKEYLNCKWEYEIEDKSIIKIEKHSEKDEEGSVFVRYVVVPKDAGETKINFKLVSKENNENISKKSYNIKVTDLGHGNYCANIIE